MTVDGEQVASGFEAPPAAAEMDAPPEGAGFVCPDCGESSKTKLSLGRHRWQKHGIPGASKKRKGAASKPRKSTASSGANTGGVRGGTGQSAMLREARAALVEAMTMSGEMMVFVIPIPGTYCVQTADDFADAVMRIAAKNPKVLKWLVQSGTMIDYAALGSWTLGLGVAFAVQTGRLPMDAPIAQRRGITAIASEFYVPTDPNVVVEPKPEFEGGGSDVVDDGGLGPAGQPRRVIPVPDLLGGSVGTPP